jgi:hypothetical protein
MAAAEAIVIGYRMRSKSENWVEFARDNPDIAALLNEAMRLAGDADNV